MQDWNDNYDEYDDGAQGNDLVKSLRKKISEDAKALKEMEKEFTLLRARERTRTVSDVLSTKGVSPKVAKLVPESIDPTEEAVSKWLSEFGDVFGVKDADTNAGKATETPPEPSSTVDPQDQAALNRMAQSSSTGVIPSSSVDEQMAKVQAASHDELLQMIAAAQNGAAA